MDKGVNYESATYPTGAFIIFTIQPFQYKYFG